MHLSRKTIAIIALVIILAASNVAFAVLYMTKNVNISGGVATVGAIEVYDSDGITPLLGYGFPLFTPGTPDRFEKFFFINNTGSTRLNVYWNISTSSITWEVDSDYYGYTHSESGLDKYHYRIEKADYPGNFWIPSVHQEVGSGLVVDVGKGRWLVVELNYDGEPYTAETFTLTMSFYATD